MSIELSNTRSNRAKYGGFGPMLKKAGFRRFKSKMSTLWSLLKSGGHLSVEQARLGSVPTKVSSAAVNPSQSPSPGGVTHSVATEMQSAVSQASPNESPSAFSWPGFAVPGQLSLPVQPDGPPLGAPGSQTPSPSASTCASEQPLVSQQAQQSVS